MSKIVDGKQLAEEVKNLLKEQISSTDRKIVLAVISAGKNPASESFIKMKKKVAREVGVEAREFNAGYDIYKSRKKFRLFIAEIVHNRKNSGVIIQLPLPEEIKNRTQYLLDAIPYEKDPDMLSSVSVGRFMSGRSGITPPVVGAINMIFEKHGIDLEGKKIVIIGAGGKLVGMPVTLWLLSKDLPFCSITEKTAESEFRKTLGEADVIISGVGSPGLITADMVKDGVVVVDAGTSADRGKLKGDIDFDVAEKASLFTPVPGGVGPIAVAMLYKNLFSRIV